MARSYLGGHSLLRGHWFGRSKQPAELPVTDSEILDGSMHARFQRAPSVFSSSKKGRAARFTMTLRPQERGTIHFLLQYARTKADLNELGSQYDPAIGARAARLKAVKKRLERQLAPVDVDLLADAELQIGGVLTHNIGEFMRVASQKLRNREERAMAGPAIGERIRVRHVADHTYVLWVRVTALCAFNEFIGKVEAIFAEGGGEVTHGEILNLREQARTFNNENILQ